MDEDHVLIRASNQKAKPVHVETMQAISVQDKTLAFSKHTLFSQLLKVTEC
jgi:hypothetical protein